MPIDIERFEDPADLKVPPTREHVIRFLIEHDDSAYTRGEIADAIDANPERSAPTSLGCKTAGSSVTASPTGR